MPKFDRSGPMGYGPETGRGSCSCRDHQDIGDQNMFCRGFERGGGYQRGFRRGMGIGRQANWECFEQQPTRQEERSFLESQAEVLQSKLDAVKQQLDKFENEQTPDS